MKKKKKSLRTYNVHIIIYRLIYGKCNFLDEWKYTRATGTETSGEKEPWGVFMQFALVNVPSAERFFLIFFPFLMDHELLWVLKSIGILDISYGKQSSADNTNSLFWKVSPT